MPYKSKSDYNRWRKEYRAKQITKGKCQRCYRPLIEESGNSTCINCLEIMVERKRLNRELKKGY